MGRFLGYAGKTYIFDSFGNSDPFYGQKRAGSDFYWGLVYYFLLDIDKIQLLGKFHKKYGQIISYAWKPKFWSILALFLIQKEQNQIFPRVKTTISYKILIRCYFFESFVKNYGQILSYNWKTHILANFGNFCPFFGPKGKN